MQQSIPPSEEVRAPHSAERQRLDQAIDLGLAWLGRSQAESGAWPGDYGGPQFLLGLYVGTCHANGIELDARTRAEMARYIRHHQNPDGGWGLHIEGHSQVFTTALNYVGLRLLDMPADDPAALRARSWLRDHGGPTAAASWGKFFLALLNLYDYRGLNPVLPELWLLPRALPVHPSRLWCHARMVYLPMSWLYARRVQCPVDARILELREELYEEPYAEVDWAGARLRVAKTDSHTPLSDVMRHANGVLLKYERRPVRALRERALRHVLEQIEREDENTSYLCIGPVSKLLHIWVWKQADPDSDNLRRHIEVLPQYLYQADDGVKMNGYNSSQFWDTSFAVQAILATGQSAEHLPMLQAAHRFIDDNQLREDLPDREGCYRSPTAGSFPFSDRAQGWPVSDCTAEGLKGALQLRSLVDAPLSPARLKQAAEFILGMQNADGGWASYERARGPAWLELLNPSDCFGKIMIDYSYVECTAACVIALRAFQKAHPGVLDVPTERALAAAREFLLAAQREDGSFLGSWGVCFTYGTWFGVQGLRALGIPTSDPAIRRAAQFLAAKQQTDGGWGETAESNRLGRYVHADHSEPVMTAWALLGLVAAGEAQTTPVQRGIEWLVAHQTDAGEFIQGHITGMFNQTCGIHYDNYPKVFPLWALAEYRAASTSC